MIVPRGIVIARVKRIRRVMGALVMGSASTASARVSTAGVVLIVMLAALVTDSDAAATESALRANVIATPAGLGTVDIRTCLYDCSQHGYCNNGTCLCQEGYRGRDCSLSSEPQPCQCAIHCVRGCLQQCTKVYETQGAGPSHECYTKCTQKCVPQCVAGKMPVNLGGSTSLPVDSVDVPF